MGKAVQVVWGVGLAGALVGTVAILKEVSLILQALDDIHQLAERTREAAEGIRANVAVTSQLPVLEDPAARLRDATTALASAATTIEQQVDGLAPSAAPRGE